MNTAIFYPVVAIVGAVLTFVLLLALRHVQMPVISYKRAGESIEVHFLGNVVVWKIEYHSVDSLRKVHFPSAAMWAIDRTVLRLGNRVVGDGILIRRKSGLFRKIVITPEFADEFVRSASEHLRPY